MQWRDKHSLAANVLKGKDFLLFMLKCFCQERITEVGKVRRCPLPDRKWCPLDDIKQTGTRTDGKSQQDTVFALKNCLREEQLLPLWSAFILQNQLPQCCFYPLDLFLLAALYWKLSSDFWKGKESPNSSSFPYKMKITGSLWRLQNMSCRSPLGVSWSTSAYIEI